MSPPSYLEVSYHRGQAFAAYLYLPRRSEDRVTRTDRVHPTMLVDYAADQRPLGIELLDPAHLQPETLNQLLCTLGLTELDALDLSPLRRAG